MVLTGLNRVDTLALMPQLPSYPSRDAVLSWHLTLHQDHKTTSKSLVKTSCCYYLQLEGSPEKD
jgi:hypothetical protein